MGVKDVPGTGSPERAIRDTSGAHGQTPRGWRVTVQSRTERRFDKSSPVARYWLAQCEGFRVKGPLNGTVEKVVGSVDEQNAESLVVRTGWRRCSIPVDAVDVVVPAARLIVVEDESAERDPAPPHHRTRAVAEASSHAAGAVAATVADKAPPFARFLRDVLFALALQIATGLVTLVRAVGVVAARAAQLAAIAVARLTALQAEQPRPRRPR